MLLAIFAPIILRRTGAVIVIITTIAFGTLCPRTRRSRRSLRLGAAGYTILVLASATSLRSRLGVYVRGNTAEQERYSAN